MPDALQEIFLAALHWRGDELWCGPNKVGEVWEMNDRSWCWYHRAVQTIVAKRVTARTALMSAARGQIEKWFKEQKE